MFRYLYFIRCLVVSMGGARGNAMYSLEYKNIWEEILISIHRFILSNIVHRPNTTKPTNEAKKCRLSSISRDLGAAEYRSRPALGVVSAPDGLTSRVSSSRHSGGRCGSPLGRSPTPATGRQH